MMADHKVELKHRLIDKIVVLGDEDMTFAKAEARTMVILLERERITPVSSPTADSSPSKKQKISQTSLREEKSAKPEETTS
jgi:hypothetical protein